MYVLSVFLLQAGAQARYLVNEKSPVKSYMYKAYRYSGPGSGKMNLTGGLVPRDLILRDMLYSGSEGSTRP